MHAGYAAGSSNTAVRPVFVLGSNALDCQWQGGDLQETNWPRRSECSLRTL